MAENKIEASNEAENDKKTGFWDTFFAIQNQKKIIDFYFNNLRVEFDSIHSKKNENEGYDSIVEKIEEAFIKAKENSEDYKNWVTAYKIENYLTHICDEDTLNTDLKRYLLIYKRHFPQQDYDHYESETKDLFEKEKATKDKLTAQEEVIKTNEKSSPFLNEKRSLLLRLQSELHAFYIKRAEQRKLAFLSRIRVTFIFLTGVVLFLLSLIYCVLSELTTPSSEMIVIVIATGFFGANFSMLVNLKTLLAAASLEDLKVLHRQGYIIARSCIGIGAALIIYFLIQSDFLSSIMNESLIPDLPINDDSGEEYQNISLLIIWSFLAGFSEMLVPNLLIGIERRITNKNKE